MFPLLVASIVSIVLHNIWIRLPVSLLAWAWCVWGKSPILSRSAVSIARSLMRLLSLSLDELFGWYQDPRRPIVLGHLPSLPLLFRFQLDDHHSVDIVPDDYALPWWAVLDRDSRRIAEIRKVSLDEFADGRGHSELYIADAERKSFYKSSITRPTFRRYTLVH